MTLDIREFTREHLEAMTDDLFAITNKWNRQFVPTGDPREKLMQEIIDKTDSVSITTIALFNAAFGFNLRRDNDFLLAIGVIIVPTDTYENYAQGTPILYSGTAGFMRPDGVAGAYFPASLHWFRLANRDDVHDFLTQMMECKHEPAHLLSDLLVSLLGGSNAQKEE